MTKIESLQYSIELWDWLADNPGKSKSQHPTLPVNSWYGNCAFCQYDTEKQTTNDFDCFHCPMRDKWPTPTGTQILCNFDCAYMTWESSIDIYTQDPHKIKLSSYDISFFALILKEAFETELTNII